jgi:GNAT superfamily N-acetyltransferase
VGTAVAITTFVAVAGTLVGAVWLSSHDVVGLQCPVVHLAGERFIQNLFVVSTARSRGHARALLQHAATVARARGVPQLYTLVFPHRIPSLKSHQAVGFEVVGTVRRQVRLHRTTVHFAAHSRIESPVGP